jgi:hypothetical protein
MAALHFFRINKFQLNQPGGFTRPVIFTEEG